MPRITTRYPSTAKAMEDFILCHEPEDVLSTFTDVFFEYLIVGYKDGFPINFDLFVQAFRDFLQLMETAKKEKEKMIGFISS